MAFLLLQCLGHRPRPTHAIKLEEDDTDTTRAANSFVTTIFLAEKNGADLRQTLSEIIETHSWRQNFAKAVFEATQKAIETARPMNDALREVYEKVVGVIDGVEGFVREHPVMCALIALGVLVLVAPWVVEAVGFAEGGVLEGSFAAEWQAAYAGFVPKGSLFSLLQRLGMKGFI